MTREGKDVAVAKGGNSQQNDSTWHRKCQCHCGLDIAGRVQSRGSSAPPVYHVWRQEVAPEGPPAPTQQGQACCLGKWLEWVGDRVLTLAWSRGPAWPVWHVSVASVMSNIPCQDSSCQVMLVG